MLSVMTCRNLTRVAAVAAMALLGACAPKTENACGPIPLVVYNLTAPTLIAPANGATGVPATTVTVQIQSANPGGQLRLTSAGGVVGGTAFAATSTPGVLSATAPVPGTAAALRVRY